MSSITLQQSRSVNVSDQYVVTSTATAAVGMQTQIFVYKLSGSVFSHVANVGDMSNYPTTPTTGIPFYRLATVTQTFDELATAIDAAAAHKTAVQSLVTAYTAATTSFVGTESTTYTG